jgi:hypothetical protein
MPQKCFLYSRKTGMKNRLIFYIVFFITLPAVWGLFFYYRDLYPSSLSVHFAEQVFFSFALVFQALFAMFYLNGNFIKRVIYVSLFMIAVQLLFIVLALFIYGVCEITGWADSFTILTNDIRNPVTYFLFVLILLYPAVTITIWEIYLRNKERLPRWL